MRVLVTGGAGFIGSHVCETLLERGHSVLIIDNLSAGRISNLDGLDIEIFIGDLGCPGTLNHLPKQKIDAIIHLAATPSVPFSISNPIETAQNNIMNTLRVLYWASEIGVQKLVFASSSSVYGEQSASAIASEEFEGLNPKSPYAVQKLTGERFCKYYRENTDLDTVVLRLFNVYGSRQRQDLPNLPAIPKMLKCISDNEEFEVFGNGQQRRSFTCVKDVTMAFCLAIEIQDIGHVFNVACEESVTLNEVIASVKSRFGNFVHINKPERAGDILNSIADIEKTKKSLGYKPQYNFKRGLQWMSEQ